LAFAKSRREDLRSIPKLPAGGLDHTGNSALSRKPEAVFCDGPQRRVEFCEDEADPLVALGALDRARRGQQARVRVLQRQVQAYGGGFRDDRAVVVKNGNFAAGVSSPET
jgi:hypothetical protein